jgi:hypothetical protein
MFLWLVVLLWLAANVVLLRCADTTDRVTDTGCLGSMRVFGGAALALGVRRVVFCT